MQRSALCRSRRELSNAYLLAKIGVDTAENEPLEVWGENSIQYSLHSLASTAAASAAVAAKASASSGSPAARSATGTEPRESQARATKARTAKRLTVVEDLS